MTLFSASLSGIQTAAVRQRVNANNLANVTTPGFKSARVNVVDTVSGGVRVGSVGLNFNQGAINITENSLDLLIQGDGFFRINTNSGIGYTRTGVFNLDAEGNMTTPDGFTLEPNIQIPEGAERVHVSRDGNVNAIMPDGTVTNVGRIQFARFQNPGGLIKEGDNYYTQGPNSGEPILGFPTTEGFGTIVTGALESSNVDIAKQITNQMVNRMVLEANVIALKTQDEMLGEIVDLRE